MIDTDNTDILYTILNSMAASETQLLHSIQYDKSVCQIFFVWLTVHTTSEEVLLYANTVHRTSIHIPQCNAGVMKISTTKQIKRPRQLWHVNNASM